MVAPISKELYRRARVVLAAPLGRTVRLGSIGYLSDGQWIEVGTIPSMFGLRLPSQGGNAEPNSYNGKGGRKLTFSAKAKGEISGAFPSPAGAPARLEIAFGSAGAFVFAIRDQTVRTLSNLAPLMAAIRFAYRYRKNLEEGQRWEKKYAVIVGLASAKSIVMLSSRSSGATAVVSAGAQSGAPIDGLGELEAEMKFTFSREELDSLCRARASGYGFQALRIKPAIFRRWDRADFEALDRGLGFAAHVPSKPGGSASYLAWAESAGIDVHSLLDVAWEPAQPLRHHPPR